MTTLFNRAAPLAYECTLMGIALFKAAEIRKSLGYRGLKLLKMIIYDQVMYFASWVELWHIRTLTWLIGSTTSIITYSILSIVSNMGPPQNTPLVLVLFGTIASIEFLITLGSRLLIHQKEAAENQLEASFRISSDTSIPYFRSYNGDDDPRISGDARL